MKFVSTWNQFDNMPLSYKNCMVILRWDFFILGCMNMASDDICNPKVAELQAEKTMQGAKKLDGKCTQNKALQRMCAKACNQCAP